MSQLLRISTIFIISLLQNNCVITCFRFYRMVWEKLKFERRISQRYQSRFYCIFKYQSTLCLVLTDYLAQIRAFSFDTWNSVSPVSTIFQKNNCVDLRASTVLQGYLLSLRSAKGQQRQLAVRVYIRWCTRTLGVCEIAKGFGSSEFKISSIQEMLFLKICLTKPSL